eukprot:TRINITY_DN37584_c0_g1_i1.p1 TRINITY_DN37584_c0_g1~~TRINITY_DN37584_c0_g1_i1.p1  ORF type:complete len:541 (+),score=116.15 TRINITY_DN37584_c0_g1_i1:149-1771(+)
MKPSTLRYLAIWAGMSAVMVWVALGGWAPGEQGAGLRDAKPAGDGKKLETKEPAGATRPHSVAPASGGKPWGLPLVPNLECGSAPTAIRNMDNDEYCRRLNASIWDELLDGLEGSRGRVVASKALKDLLIKQAHLQSEVAAGREPPGQRYIIWSLSGGVGNRMQAMVSTFLTALLSGRVILLKDWFTTTSKKGTPAARETSTRHDGFLEGIAAPSPNTPHNSELLCAPFPIIHLSDFRAKYPHYFEADGRDEHLKIDIISTHDKHYKIWRKLACSDPVEIPDSTVKFTYVWTNQYYLPLYFANPSTADVMLKLFPNGDAFGPLARFLIRPNKQVEEVVERFWCAHDKGVGREGLLVEQDFARRRVYGLQMRAFRKHAMVGMAKEFEKCMKEHLKNESYSLFIASLHSEIRQYYEGKYAKRLISLDAVARGEQQTGSVEMDREALADMLILGRTADYLASPGSTFGSFVTGYYGRRPIQVHTMGANTCTRMTSSQPCFMSLLRHDKVLQHFQKHEFGCSPAAIPEPLTANCAPHLSIPFKK